MAEGKLLPYLDVPFQHASRAHPQAHEAPGLQRKRAGARACLARDLSRPRPSAAPSSPVFPARPKRISRNCWTSWSEAQLDRVGCFVYSPVAGARGQRVARHACLKRWAPSGALASWRCRKTSARRAWSARSTASSMSSWTRSTTSGAVARSAADAPDIDGLVYVTDGEALAVGDRRRVTVIDSDTHDLYAQAGRVNMARKRRARFGTGQRRRPRLGAYRRHACAGRGGHRIRRDLRLFDRCVRRRHSRRRRSRANSKPGCPR